MHRRRFGASHNDAKAYLFGFPVSSLLVHRDGQGGIPSADHESRSDRLDRVAKDTFVKQGRRSGKTYA